MERFKFESPATIVLSGQSGSGKTTLALGMLDHRDSLFSQPIRQTIFVYRYNQPWMSKYRSWVRFVKEIPQQLESNTLLCVDDCGMESSSLQTLVSLFCRGIHHQNSNLIFVTQNLFYPSPAHRTCLLNAKYLILFSSLRSLYQVQIFGRNTFGTQNAKEFLNIYKNATQSQPFGYLAIDLSPSQRPYRLTTQLLPNETQIVYKFDDEEEEEEITVS